MFSRFRKRVWLQRYSIKIWEVMKLLYILIFEVGIWMNNGIKIHKTLYHLSVLLCNNMKILDIKYFHGLIPWTLLLSSPTRLLNKNAVIDKSIFIPCIPLDFNSTLWGFPPTSSWNIVGRFMLHFSNMKCQSFSEFSIMFIFLSYSSMPLHNIKNSSDIRFCFWNADLILHTLQTHSTTGLFHRQHLSSYGHTESNKIPLPLLQKSCSFGLWFPSSMNHPSHSVV